MPDSEDRQRERTCQFDERRTANPGTQQGIQLLAYTESELSAAAAGAAVRVSGLEMRSLAFSLSSVAF